MSDSTGNTKPTSDQDLRLGAPYKKGDFIGQKYEVYKVLGKGGCGVVYLVYSSKNGGVYALKTFRDEFLTDPETRLRFRREAGIWVGLGRHPYLVRAYFVEEISGRLYIGMEYIAPNEAGLNSLDGYLQCQPPDLAQSLRWAIQMCYGMEYAYSKGVRTHRDLKPANIMITQDLTAKITDFGIAGVRSEGAVMGAAGLNVQTEEPRLSGETRIGTGIGTPTHMAPEQFANAAGCDERSDIYSFGIVLYQMVTGGQVPFLPVHRDGSPPTWEDFQRLHHEESVPRLDSPLFSVIQRCLQKSPDRRFQAFKEVRGNLELLLQRRTGEVIVPAQLKELEAWEWTNKGISLGTLGRYDEAIGCYDKAIGCYDKALELDPRFALAWNNKGSSLDSLGRYEEAIGCYDKALELDPRFALAWSNKGNALDSLGRYEEAIDCYDKALELDPRHAAAWSNKGNALDSLGRYDEAIACYDKALELDPRHAVAWSNKGNALDSLGRYEEAIACYDKALELDPRHAAAWSNKGNALDSLGRYDEAIICFDRALELDPRYVNAWLYKALAEDGLNHPQEASQCYRQFLALAPAQATQLVEYARERLQKLEDSSGSE
jgi:tetratricopeptide (TPR) repeat protein